MTREGLISLHDLVEDDFAQIERLAEISREYDGVAVKLNWDLIRHRDPGQVSDFGYYHDDQLVGYMSLDGFGESYEITAIVQPEFRRQGIFRRLLDEAREEAKRRDAKELLLVNYKRSESGTAMAQSLGIPYQFSEYRMVADLDTISSETPLELVEVTENDLTELARLLSIAFDEGGWSTVDKLREQFQRKDGRYWFARLGGESIGQIGAIADGDGIYIRAVGIVPEYRGKGYGRQLLAALMHMMTCEGQHHFELDVEVRNSNALSLYESCGFREANVYDYYVVTV